MRITDRQSYVLDNLHRIEIRPRMRKTEYLLEGTDCRYQIVCLAAKGIIAWVGEGRPSKIVEPGRVITTRWGRHDDPPAGLKPSIPPGDDAKA